jgi:hypothetical protein
MSKSATKANFGRRSFWDIEPADPAGRSGGADFSDVFFRPRHFTARVASV